MNNLAKFLQEERDIDAINRVVDIGTRDNEWGIVKVTNVVNSLLAEFNYPDKLWDVLNKGFVYTQAVGKKRIEYTMTLLKAAWMSHRHMMDKPYGNEVEYHYCPFCGKMSINSPGFMEPLPKTMYGVARDTLICNTCRQMFFRCNRCEKIIFDDRPLYINSEPYCKNCWSYLLENGDLITCQGCGAYVLPQDAHVHNENFYCDVCHDGRGYECEGCGKYLIDGPDTIWWTDDDMAYCEDCYRAEQVVAAYDFFDDQPTFLSLISERTRPDTLFFGCEFEIEMDWGECARHYYTENQIGTKMKDGIPSGIEWGYVKHDGSMRNGVEFVTNPMTEAFYRTHRKVLDQMFNNWSKAGFRTDQWDDEKERYNCSLHMHMSKDAFSSGHLYKFVRFFYKIPMRKFIQSVSQRSENEYAQWCPDDFQYGAKLAKEKKNCSMNRYSVINLIGGHWHEQMDRPAKTVEFRLFQGSMDPAIIHKNIEFMLSVYYFTRDTSITHITQKNYIKYLRAYRNRYRYLVDFLNNELGKGV